ncbi:exodeoxyribonuclease III [Lysinibacillus xylanilyticus]|uniref:exodeoxyribonuclease III n=1 Tax=Lysinibacillus xylanilyticus TaxID=582475 RepID=UPI0036DED6F8
MLIISWNVNGFRSIVRKGALADLISEYEPDLLFIQETKCTEYEFLKAFRECPDYVVDNYLCHVEGCTLPGRYGVALLAKNSVAFDSNGDHLIQWFPAEDVDPKLTRYREARLQAFVIKDILMLNTYSVRVTNELEGLVKSILYNEHILDLLSMWKDIGNDKALLIGDLNLTPKHGDQHEGKTTMPILGMTPEEKDKFIAFFIHPDLHDTFRELHPNLIKYSYWSYRTFARSTGKGHRLDYAIATTALMKLVVESNILTYVEGSDHAPIILELREEW